MPDWNETESEGLGGFRKPHKGKLSKNTGQPSGESRPADNRAADWRQGGKSKESTGSKDAVWNVSEVEPSQGFTSSQWRWLISIAALTIGISATIVPWAIYIWRNPIRLPIYDVVLGTYESELIGDNPFQQAERKIWGGESETRGDGIVISLQDAGDQAVAATELIERIQADPHGLDHFLKTKLPTHRGKAGGGPQKNNRVWIISGIAGEHQSTTTARPTLVLYRPSGKTNEIVDPSLALAAEGLPVSELLRQIAENTPPGELGLVLLDLRSPPTVLDLQRIAPRWKTLVEAAVESESVISERLVVGVAASDGEVNWTAPELNGGVFKHFCRLGLLGNADSNDDRLVSVAELRKYVDENVRAWVATRRNAIQSPSWFERKGEKSTGETQQLVRYNPEQAISSSLGRNIDPTQNWPLLLGLWKRHAAIKSSAAISHPLELGAIEADLILLQEMLERDSQSNWGKLVSRVEKNLQVCETKPSFLVFTSLHETHSQRAAESSIEAMNAWGRAFRERSHPPSNPQADSPPPEPTPLPELTIDQLGWVCWTEIIRRPRGNESSAPVEYAQDARLDLDETRALLNAYWESRSNSERGAIEYQEIHYLRLLLEEIDWVSVEQFGQKAATADAVLDLCRCFDMLMESGGRYGLDSHHWLEPELTKLEQRLMSQTDQLLGGTIPDLDKRKSLQNDFVKLTNTSRRLSWFCRQHLETIADLPHLLTWIASGHAVAQMSFLDANGEVKEYQSHFEAWKKLLAEVENFSLWKTKQADQNAIAGLLDSGQKLDELQRQLRDKWNRFSEELANAVQKETSDVNYRKFLIALHSPLTVPNHRDGIFTKWSSFIKDYDGAKSYEMRIGAIKDSTLGNDNPYTLLWDKWPKHSESLPSPESYAILREVYSGQRPSESSFTGLLQDQGLQATVTTIRHAALMFGHRYRREPQSLWSEWGKRLQAHLAENRARHWRTQGLRITRMAFGNGDSRSNLVEPYYFAAANIYLQAIGKQNTTDKTYEELNEKLKAQRDWIDDLRISLEAKGGITYSQQEKKKDIVISLQADPPPDTDHPVIGSLRLMDGGFRSVEARSAFIKLQPDIKARIIPVDLNYFRDQNKTSLDGVLAFRGHHRRTQIVMRENGTDRKFVDVEYKQLPDLPDTRLMVRAAAEPPLLEIMLLLDCSASTRDEVEGKMLYFHIREQASRLLDHFEELHQKGAARVRIGVMLFGLLDAPEHPRWPNEGMPKLRSGIETDTALRDLKLDSQSLKNQIAATSSNFLDAPNWKDNLKHLIDNYVIGTGNTPLYLAIDQAMNRLDTANRLAIQEIIVIGDGVNNIDSEYYSGDRLSITGLTTNLQKHDLGLPRPESVFGPRVSLLLYGAERGTAAKEELRELDALSNRFGERFKVLKTNNFSIFVNELNALLPDPKVTISSADSNDAVAETSRLKEWIPVPLKTAGPLPVNVTVKGFSGTSSTPQPLPLYVNQQAVLTLSNLGQRLVWHGWQEPTGWLKWEAGDLSFEQRLQRHHNNGLLNLVVAARPSKEHFFPYRPQAILAKLEQVQGDEVLGTFNLWDHQFVSHGDEANNSIVDERSNASVATETIRFGSVPWFNKPFDTKTNSLGSLNSRLTVWVSEKPLPEGHRLRVAANEKPTKDIGQVHFEVDHRGEAVIVKVADKSIPVSADGRVSEAVRRAEVGSFDWIVRTEGAESTTRKYSVDGSEAEHEIRLLPAARNKPVVIEFQSFSTATKSGMTELRFQRKETTNL